MQIYIVRYNPFLYHLGLKLNVKPFPIICALLCLERNKYGKERFIVGCLVFIKWYVWSLTKEFKFSSILQTQQSVITVAFSASSSRFPQFAPFQGSFRGMLSLCGIAMALRAERAVLLLCLGSYSTEQGEPMCPRRFCSLTGIKPGWCMVYPLCGDKPRFIPFGAGLRLPWLWLRCLPALQFPWENFHSCARAPALLGTQGVHGKGVEVLPVCVEECLGSLTPLQSVFIAPRTLSVVYMGKE